MTIERSIDVGYGFEIKHTEPTEGFSEFLDLLMDNFGIEDLGPFTIISNIDMYGGGEESKIFLILKSSRIHLDCNTMNNVAKSINPHLEQKELDEAYDYLEKIRGILEPVHEDMRIHVIGSEH